MKVIGVILIALALVIGIVPQFTDCLAQGSAMKMPNGNLLPMRPDLPDVIPQMPRTSVAQSKAGNNTHLSSESRRRIF